MSDNVQDKLSRVRPPRVHITYDVETGGAIEKKELPFVVGVLADLSGHPAKALEPVKDRKFVQIDRDNLNEVMEKVEPRLAIQVANRIRGEDDTMIPVELKFKNLNDFQPAAVAEQVTPIRKLLEVRRALANLRSNLVTNDKLGALLEKVLTNTETLGQLAAEMGVEPRTDTEPAEGKEGK